MSEPITLYRGNETVTTCAPSEAQRLLNEGWTHEQGQRQEGQVTQGKQREVAQEGQEERQAVEPDPQFDAPLTMTLEYVQKPKRKAKA